MQFSTRRCKTIGPYFPDLMKIDGKIRTVYSLLDYLETILSVQEKTGKGKKDQNLFVDTLRLIIFSNN